MRAKWALSTDSEDEAWRGKMTYSKETGTLKAMRCDATDRGPGLATSPYYAEISKLRRRCYSYASCAKSASCTIAGG